MSRLLTQDGGALLLQDGGHLLLQEPVVVTIPGGSIITQGYSTSWVITQGFGEGRGLVTYPDPFAATATVIVAPFAATAFASVAPLAATARLHEA
jgi:hypothetical protein